MKPEQLTRGGLLASAAYSLGMATAQIIEAQNILNLEKIDLAADCIAEAKRSLVHAERRIQECRATTKKEGSA